LGHILSGNNIGSYSKHNIPFQMGKRARILYTWAEIPGDVCDVLKIFKLDTLPKKTSMVKKKAFYPAGLV
jgi:hypothetical protein